MFPTQICSHPFSPLLLLVISSLRPSFQSYNCLDPVEEEFPKDFQRFKDQIFDLDRRLAAILCNAFEDCSGSEAIYKVW
jgi:hypothetical protein